ncbi:AcrB/AcrD/AcrF family protein, partial [Sphingobacteriales bacterium UPWRP_1]
TVEFELGNNLEEAANDVRDKVSQTIRQLPADLDAPPVVSKADANSDAIISMTVTSNTRNQLQVTDFATNVLLEKLQTIPGVSTLQIWGEKRYAMRIWMDPVKLSMYGLTAQDVVAALQRENIELPSGKLAGNSTDLSVRTYGKLTSEADFANLIISNKNNNPVRLSDVATAVLGPENEETVLKESGIPMIALALVPQPGSNYVAIADEFYKRYNQLKKEVPEDIKLDIVLDNTQFIKKSISEVEETLLIAFLLVILIIYLFFRDWLIAVRPLIDIPVSLIGAFFIMYVFGFTINILTLLAIVLATGLVVDDGIVVTENIFKRLEKGVPKMKAALEGSEEIYFVVIATSVTLAVVFLPIIFLQGFVGRLFREFGIVVSGAVLISAFVSLSLTPVLNVWLTKSKPKHSWFYTATEPFFAALESGYRKTLRLFARIKVLSVLLLAACFAGIYYLFQMLPAELAPLEDRSQFRLSVTAPEGTSFDAMDKYMDALGRLIIDSVPENRMLLTVTAPSFAGSGSVNSGFARIALVEPKERLRSQQEVVAAVNKLSSKLTQGRAFAIQEQTIATNKRGGLPVAFVLQNISFDKLKAALPAFLEEASKSEVLQQIDVDLKFNKPELSIEINRSKAADLGISVAEISEALQMAFSNRRISYFTMNGKQYQVLGQWERGYRDDPTDLKNIYVKTASGSLVSIDNVVQISEQTSPPTIYHFNRYKSATVSAGLAPGKTIGDGIAEMQRIADKVLDESFNTALTGASKDYAESASNTGFAFILALILIFLILAAQFESFIDPVIIMLTVPMAICGALLSLLFFGQTINIFSQIGMIMLIGLVTKNGILIVEFANTLMERGKPKTEAAIEAAVMRMRPIVMTSLAMSLGALPIALSLGDAATSRIPLGIVIVGGIMFSLILTLFIIPVMYTIISRRKPLPQPAENTSL